MTDQRIAEIKARCEAATRGPWELGYGNTIKDLKIHSPWIEDAWEGDEEADNNMKFIVQTRQDIPFLLTQLAAKDAEIERLQREVAQLAIESFNRVKELAKLEGEIERLRETQRWIPVAERLPTEKDADRLGFIVAHSTSMGQSTVCVWHHILDDGVTTHWMPLPAPPEKC